MQVSRRQFLGTAALAALVPTWLHRAPAQIDLKAFCRPAQDLDWYRYRYDMTAPFVQLTGQDPFAFATDASICVRVKSAELPKEDPGKWLAPANNLPWPDRNSAGWKVWPAQRLELARGTDCPRCKGAAQKCKVCGLVYDEDHFCDHLANDFLGNLVECSTCNGFGQGVFPGVQRLDEFYVSEKYDRLVRAKLPGLEYRMIEYPRINKTMIGLRFDGGEGFLTHLDPKKVKERLA